MHNNKINSAEKIYDVNCFYTQYSYLGGGAKSYDDRGLWCYQLYNDGGGQSYQSYDEVCGATKSVR